MDAPTGSIADAWAALARLAAPHAERLARALARPAAAQHELRSRILRANAASDFARAHGLRPDMTLSAFREAVEVRTYDAFRPWIDAIGDGHATALTGERVLAFEETGGSTGGRKLVPYTQAALAGFAAAVLPWMADLLRHRPELASTRAYFAVSPAPRSAKRYVGGIPVGLDSEAAYFGEAAAPIARVGLLPDAAAMPHEVDSWAIATAARLAAEPELGLVSVWSPTFLACLLDAIEGSHEAVARLVRDGGCGTQGSAPAAARLSQAMAGDGRLDAGRLWPRLRVVSCWADASAHAPATALRRRLPEGVLQPKGLLATEGAFTLPLLGRGASVPALTSAFLEFEDAAGELHLADALRAGEDYDLIVTTVGGFTRYRIGDRVRCGEGGSATRAPSLRFLGRSGMTSDLVGEKLTEDFVLSCLEDLAGAAVLCGDVAQYVARYVVLTAAAAPLEPPRLALVEARLRRNPQYDQARRLGQLGPLATRAVPDLLARHRAAGLASGQRLGDIKPPALLGPDQAGIWPNHAETWPDPSP